MDFTENCTVHQYTFCDSNTEMEDSENTDTNENYVPASRSSLECLEKSGATFVPSWEALPSELQSYNPLIEWGDHYARILQGNNFPKETHFDYIDLFGDEIESGHISGREATKSFCKKDPDFRIIYCDSQLCHDGIVRGSVAAEDIKLLLLKYDMSICFLDFFVGRNRPTIGSRKTYNPSNPSKIIAYDLWYILPSRIYGDEEDYDSHFILFMVYIHYDCRTKKTFMFCIHRLGSENQESAKRSSLRKKLRLREALEAICKNPSMSHFKSNPFVLQLSMITSVAILWTTALHKERISMWKREDEGRQDLAKIDTAALHNVSRYIHSYKTNILFTLRVLVFLRKENAWFAKRLGTGLDYTKTSAMFRTVEDTLDSQIWQMEMVATYADEVMRRTKILLDIYFNWISKKDSHSMAAIAEETQRDAVSMRTIAVVTLIFLPATFICAFFSMTFFSGGPFDIEKLWLYPATVIPTTTAVLGFWCLLKRRSQKKKIHSSAIDIGNIFKQKRILSGFSMQV